MHGISRAYGKKTIGEAAPKGTGQSCERGRAGQSLSSTNVGPLDTLAFEVPLEADAMAVESY